MSNKSKSEETIADHILKFVATRPGIKRMELIEYISNNLNYKRSAVQKRVKTMAAESIISITQSEKNSAQQVYLVDDNPVQRIVKAVFPVRTTPHIKRSVMQFVVDTLQIK